MLVKIKGTDSSDLEANIDRVMNVACIAHRKGRLLRDRDLIDRRKGEYWYRDGNTFELYPSLNNDKAFVRHQGHHFVIVEFYSRYDSSGVKSNAISNLIVALFPNDTELVEE